jgi:hypothetical protein
MRIWSIKYQPFPLAYTTPAVARIEAETAADARALLMDRLGEDHDYKSATYVENYKIGEPQPYEPPAAKGRILSMDESGGGR